MTAERRRDPRVPFRAQTEVRFTTWESFKYVYMMNLSRGGMALSLPQRPLTGDTVQVKLLLPNGDAVELEGRVKHAKEVIALEGSPAPRYFRVGVAFDELTDERRAQLERLIATRAGAPAVSRVAPAETAPAVAGKR